jgi:RimJ/RimL family protein N-acetyltransferase
MSELIFVPMDEAGYHVFRSWFSKEERQRRLQGGIQHPDRRWFDYVRHEPDVYAWLVYDGAVAVGQVQLDVVDGTVGHVGIFVSPELRNLGYCKRVLRTLLSLPEVAVLAQLEAGVHVENLPSRRCLEAVGFEPAGEQPDTDGFLQFVYPMRCA